MIRGCALRKLLTTLGTHVAYNWQRLFGARSFRPFTRCVYQAVSCSVRWQASWLQSRVGSRTAYGRWMKPERRDVESRLQSHEADGLELHQTLTTSREGQGVLGFASGAGYPLV